MSRHEQEYKYLPPAERHRPTRRRLSLDEDTKPDDSRKWRENMEFAASYMSKIRAKAAAAKSSSPHITPTSTRDSSLDEIRTSDTSLYSFYADNLDSDGKTPRLTTSDGGGMRRGRLPFRSPNTRCLADVANRNTISKDNTTGDEARATEIMATIGKKTCGTLQQVKKLQAGGDEWHTTGRRVRRGLSTAFLNAREEVLPGVPFASEYKELEELEDSNLDRERDKERDRAGLMDAFLPEKYAKKLKGSDAYNYMIAPI